jgi:hypothetical protein
MIGVVMEQRTQIMARAAEGDAQAFALLIEPLLNPAYRLASNPTRLVIDIQTSS